MKLLITIILACISLSSYSFSAPSTYKVSHQQNAPIRFKISYTMGTHEGASNIITGSAKLNLEEGNVSGSGEFQVPIESIKTGNLDRDCHMLESLGLDYSKSDFPKKHVCADEKIPASGNNSLSYRTITLKIKSINKTLQEKGSPEIPIFATGSWTIHGVEQPAELNLKLTSLENGFRVQGSSNLDLRDFNVIVKSAKALFLTISSSDIVRIFFDVLLDKTKK